MAEVLGTVASAIAVVELAGKAVTVSFKLKSLWEEVKDLPDTLLEKAEELQDLDDFLRDAESHATISPLPSSVWNGTIMRNAIGRARAAMDDFQRTLDMHIDSLADKQRRKQKLAAAKIVFQKGSLEAMERKLDRALRLFRMAQNQYCVICASMVVERLPRPLDESDANNDALFIVERLPQSADEYTDSDEAGDFFGSANYFPEFLKLTKSHLAETFTPDAAAMSKGTSLLGRLRFGLSYQASHISIRTPDWLGNTVYSVMAHQSMAGWQLNLLSYAVVDAFPKSINDAIENDDLISLQKSLRQMSLTPHVHDQHGTSLLLNAAYYGAVEVSRWLLSVGLYPGSFGEWSLSQDLHQKGPVVLSARTPLERLLQGPVTEIKRTADILRTFTAYTPDIIDNDCDIWVLAINHKTFEQYREVQQVIDPELLSAPFSERLRHCFRAIIDTHWALSEILFLLPEMRSFSTDSIKSFWSMSEQSISLSHLIAMGVIWEIWGSNGKLLQPLAKGSYLKAIGDIAGLSPEDLSLTSRPIEKTAFVIMMERTMEMAETHSPRVFDRILQSAITSWVSILHANEVNLLDYGYKERLSVFTYREGRIPGWRDFHVRRHSYFRVLGITYGTLPEQWRIWWSVYGLEYAGEFWHMVESPAVSIPGSWKDDFDSHEENPYCSENVPWDDEERGDWIVWSEYRRKRPPC